MPDGGMPEEVRKKAALAASSTRRSLDENIVAAAGIAYSEGLAAGRAEERARVVEWLRDHLQHADPYATARLRLAARMERGEHLAD